MSYIIEKEEIVGYKKQFGSLIPIQKVKIKYVGKKISESEIYELIDSIYDETLNIEDKEELENYIEKILYALDIDLNIIITIKICILSKRDLI